MGLPAGAVGTGQASYLVLGSGQAPLQPLAQIDRALETDALWTHPLLVDTLRPARQGGRALHLLGLVSDGQVHSAERHYFALLELIRRQQVPSDRVFIHAFLDGHDTPPRSGLTYLARFAAEMMRTGVGRLATVCGRADALDDQRRWERTRRVYRALVEGEGRLAPSALHAVKSAYARGEEDRSFPPTVILDEQGLPYRRLTDGDVLLWFNHRSDRGAQLLEALLERDFTSFPRAHWPRLHAVCLTDDGLPRDRRWPAVFPAPQVTPTVGELLARQGLPQWYVAESEAFPHLQHFYAGGKSLAPPPEQCRIIPSPDLDDYAAQPSLHAAQVTAEAVRAIRERQHALVVLNYANADLVGHTGNFTATVQAVETLDRCLGEIVEVIQEVSGTLLVTADHGNAEQMQRLPAAVPNPAHTAYPVPFILVDERYRNQHFRVSEASLCDVAPTLLRLLGLPIPAEMAGVDLLTLLEEEPAAERDLAAPSPPKPVLSAAEGLGGIEGGPATGRLSLGVREVLVLAIQAEREAGRLFSRAAEFARDEASAALYRHLAQDEERHRADLERRYALLGEGSPPAPPRGVRFEELNELPDPQLHPQEVLEVAIQAEKDAYELLSDLAARNEDPEGRRLIEQLAAEEWEHYERLQELHHNHLTDLVAALPTSVALH